MNYEQNITFYQFFFIKVVVIQQKLSCFQIVSIMYWQYILILLIMRRLHLSSLYVGHICIIKRPRSFRQQLGVWSKELSKCFSKFVISITLCQQFGSNLKIFRMEIQNANTTPSTSSQLRNVSTIRWESWNLTTQPLEIHDRKSEVIAFVVSDGMNVTTNNFYN